MNKMDMAITGKATYLLFSDRNSTWFLEKMLMSLGYSNLDLVELETYVDSTVSRIKLNKVAMAVGYAKPSTFSDLNSTYMVS